MKNKNLSVIGIGRLGLCFSLTLEKAGFNVIGCDVVKEYVECINNKTFFSYENMVNEYLRQNKNFFATTELKKAVEHARVIFVTVASFSEEDGRYDVSQVENVVESIISLGYQEEEKHLVICTNVNPGYSNTVFERIKDLNWQVTYNPETVAQGTILHNQSSPDCVYVGSCNEELADEIVGLYEIMCKNSPRIHTMDRLSAELTKVSLNCYLTCKISFANMVGDLATKLGADPDKVLKAVGSDKRINNKFFKYGFGWGGPCFPRDTRAFIRLAENNNMFADMCESSRAVNKKHLQFQIEQFKNNHNIEEKVFIDGVTYKEGVVILEESQKLLYANALSELGYNVIIVEDEPVIKELKRIYNNKFEYELKNKIGE